MTFPEWSCPADGHVSPQMLGTMERLHESGVLAGGIDVTPVNDEKTYTSLIRTGHAQVSVRGRERPRVDSLGWCVARPIG